MSDIKELTKKILEFRNKRNWKNAHTPKNSAISLSLEAAELLEHFQWHEGKRLERYIATNKKEIAYELADVFYWVLLMSHDLGIDIKKAMQEKLEINKKKYFIKEFKEK